MTGLEPARRGHQNLNLARLPIPPHPLICGFIKPAQVSYHFHEVMSTWLFANMTNHIFIYLNEKYCRHSQ